MEKVFNISELISTDIRSRANANIIRSAIDGIEGDIVLDFKDVKFVSRSFADELYNVMNEHDGITLINESDFVKSMLDAVTQASVWHAVMEIAAARAMGLVIVSHSPALLARVATRVEHL